MPSSERLDEGRFGREFPPGTVLQLDCQRAFDHIDMVDIGMLVLPNVDSRLHKSWTMNPASANRILIAASLNWNYMAKTARIPYRQNSAGRVARKKTFMHKVSFKLNGGKRQPPLKLNCAMFNS
jgi:hypothetical protein